MAKSKLKKPTEVVQFICDIPPDIPAPADRVDTPEQLTELAQAPGAACLLIDANSKEDLEKAIARLNRLNTGSKPAFLQAGEPRFNPDLGKYESVAFVQPLAPEEEVRPVRKRFGFIQPQQRKQD